MGSGSRSIRRTLSFPLLLRLALVTVAGLWTAGASSCTTTTSGCPPVVPYTADEQTQACTELRAMCPAAKKCEDVRLDCPRAVVPRMIDDYKLMRDQSRACRGK